MEGGASGGSESELITFKLTKGNAISKCLFLEVHLCICVNFGVKLSLTGICVDKNIYLQLMKRLTKQCKYEKTILSPPTNAFCLALWINVKIESAGKTITLKVTFIIVKYVHTVILLIKYNHWGRDNSLI